MKMSSLKIQVLLINAVLLITGEFSGTNMQAGEKVALQLPAGFEASRFCDNQLCPDIQCLTTDSRGNVVASGPGYIRILIDTDADGSADAVREFASGPKSGAQGMFFEGNNLYCIGDNGLYLYHDKNGDGISEGKPELIRKFKAGGEHHTHAIRKGPDGWWYIIAGNMAEIQRAGELSEKSPISSPQAGVLFRLSPNFSQTEILTDGLRNAYDFDFDSTGDLFTFDSDGERDISLPWYRPTRVFQTVSGMNCGWISRSWKKPNYFEEMSPVLAEFARGSPTGVVCYQHQQFPQEFRGALFVLDWTYGRIFALKKVRQGSTWVAQAKQFVSAKGDYGFAPTDAVVGPRGSLYVSVGGRGTQGSIYRISYAMPAPVAKKDSGLNEILNAAQPLSPWSRAKWEPQAKELGEETFITAALNESRSVQQRLRAIEILTELFHGPDVDFMKSMQTEFHVNLRTRAVWAYGRVTKDSLNENVLKPFLHDENNAVIRAAFEVLLTLPERSLDSFTADVANGLAKNDRVISYLASQVAARMSDEAFQEVGEQARQTGWSAAIAMSRGFINRGYIGHPYSWHDIGLMALSKNEDPQVLLAAVLLIQQGLGGFGYNPQHADVFDSYQSRLALPNHPVQLEAVRKQIVAMYPTGNQRLDWELGRLASMIAISDSEFLDQILAQIDEESHPVLDLHHLIICARISGVRSEKQSQKIARSLLAIFEKTKTLNLAIDRNWDSRVGELYDQLAMHDDSLSVSLLADPAFGKEETTLFVESFSGKERQAALQKYLQLAATGQVELTPRLLSLLAELPTLKNNRILHIALKDNSLRSIALITIAKNNRLEDRKIILSGFNAQQWNVVAACLQAGSAWETSTDTQLVAFVNLLNRIANDDQGEKYWGETLRLTRQVAMQVNVALESIPPETPLQLTQKKAKKQIIAHQWRQWAQSHFPELKNKFVKTSLPVNWQAVLARVDWNNANAIQGEKIYHRQQCSQCHGGRTAIGPDLRGVATRFALKDLLIAIVDPHRNVPPRYQSTAIVTQAGKTYTGIIIYESTDGLLLRDRTHQTIRINTHDIEERKKLRKSLMPENLLKNCTEQDIADLFAYLKSLR